MKRWIGPYLIAVSIVHTLYAALVYREMFVLIVQRGIFATADDDPSVALAVWFAICGGTFFICGLAVSALERAPMLSIPKRIGWSLLGLAIFGAALMPAGGFWLFFPPSLAVLFRKKATTSRP